MTETDLATWQKRAGAVEFPSWMFVDGARVAAASGRTMPVTSPRDGAVLSAVPASDAGDVDLAVAAARRAFDDGRWADQAPAARKAVLLRLADLLLSHADEMALLITLDMGKPITDARTIEVPAAARAYTFFAEAIDKYFGEVIPTDPNSVAMVVREPVGVVGAVVPWNFPLQLASWKVAPALAAGNSVVLKPASQSTLSALRLGELAIEAGLPAGVLNVVTGDGPTAGAALGRHPDVDKVAFTGSTAVGKLFLRYSAESNLKQVSLECGGKAPQVVLADVPDLDLAAWGVTRGIFFNQGEVCTAGSRLIVHRSIHDRLLEKVLDLAGRFAPRDPLDPGATFGAIVDADHVRRIERYVEGATGEGAHLVLGGKRALEDLGGCYYEPTVFDEVTPTMQIAREEVFGPVLATIQFDDVDDAMRIANSTIYGLNAAVWTRDLTTAHRLARRLRAGMVSVNGFGGVNMSLPFGGVKQSGFGRDNSVHALDGYTTLKSITINLV